MHAGRWLPLVLVFLAACGETAPPAGEPDAAAEADGPMPEVPAYVPNQRSGTVSVIDTATDQVARTLDGDGGLGGRLQQVMIGSGGDRLYVVDAQAHRLHELDVASDRILRSVDIGENAEGVAESPDGRRFAVCVEGQNEVMLIDPETFEVGTRIQTRGRAPEHCVFSPDGRWLLTSNEGSDDLDLIDVEAAESVAAIAVSGHPRGIAFSDDGRIAYVAQESANTVDIVDLQARTRTASIPAGERTAGLVLSEDGSRLYASNGSGSVSVIDTQAREEVARIQVGQRPWNPALTPDGGKLYVANGRSNSVSVIDTGRMEEIRQIPVGEMPWGVVIAR
ncbi:beta-propeller fold lactonase family protein [Coralloluteibacterium stylophorae]|nr:cytochrome D1 domain-containing protein [Coralloluteibacterium stylophorae]